MSKPYIVWDPGEDWLFSVLFAEDETEACYEASEEFGKSRVWSDLDERQDGQRYATFYVMEWKDTSMTAIEYYTDHEKDATVFVAWELVTADA